MKLKGLPKIIYLNSKHHSKQNQLMLDHFDLYGIENYIRYEKKYDTQFREFPIMKRREAGFSA